MIEEFMVEKSGVKMSFTIYQAGSKQDFVNHVHDLHVEAEEYFCKIEDGSLSDIFCPWEEDTKDFVVKNELEIKDNSVEFKDSPAPSLDDDFEVFEENDNYDSDYIDSDSKSSAKLNSKKGHYCSMGHSKIFCETIEEYDQHFRENHQNICKDHPCSKCEKSYSTLRVLKLHKLDEHGITVTSKRKRKFFRRGFSCSIGHSQIFYQTIEDLNNHVKNEHKEDNAEHLCSKCSQSFCSIRVLDLHCTVEHDQPRFTCSQCLKIFPNRKARAAHLLADHKPANDGRKQLNKCSVCSWKGSSLGEHWKTEHSDLSLPFLCHLCDHATYCEKYLKLHIYVQHGDKSYKCEICGKESKLLVNHEKHKKTHSDQKEFTCDMCAKGFRTIRSLKTHLFKQHGVDFDEKEKTSMLKDIERRPKMKPVDPECLKCNRKTFRNIEDFNDHVLNCYGRRLLSIDFICNKKNCSRKKWNSAEVLHYHLFSEHQVSDRVCDICGTIVKCPWNTVNNLIRHKSFVHYDQKPETEKFSCDQCDKIFASKQRMKYHVEVKHLGIKKYECESCGYKTNQKCRLADHENIMHKKEPLNCKYCDFMCYSRTIYGKHNRKFHKDHKKVIKINAF